MRWVVIGGILTGKIWRLRVQVGGYSYGCESWRLVIVQVVKFREQSGIESFRGMQAVKRGRSGQMTVDG
jgi:hypothetical protein